MRPPSVRRDLLAIVVLAGAALGLRVYPAWDGVLGGGRANFLETDAWYHLRLIENQVANFPRRVTFDPYAAAGGQFVPIAPLYDTITAVAAVLLHGRDASADETAWTAAFVPPVLGGLAVLVAGMLASRVFGGRAGWLAAALLAVLPGHFMDRTMLGFVDHHALEALLAVATLLALVVALQDVAASVDRAPARLRWWDGLAGLVLGLYLLAWASGALLLAILGAWLIAVVILARRAEVMLGSARTLVAAASVALALVLAFQHPEMHRFDTQVIGALGLAAVAAGIAFAARGIASRPSSAGGDDPGRTRRRVLGSLAIAGVAALAALWAFRPGLMMQLLTDAARLTPDPARMGVLEARPLFSYPGEFNWRQPWQFFRSGFYVGLVGLAALAPRVWHRREPGVLLVWVYAAAMFVATIGQNRFGYYLIPGCAVLGGWLADRVLAFGERESPTTDWRSRPLRLLPTVAVAGLMFAPAVPSDLLFLRRGGQFTAYWQEAIDWLADHTPPPFEAAGQGDDYYRSRYAPPLPAPDYTVMNWWDQGYYLIQRAHRVPVSNPTQSRAPIAARFYTETDEARALAILAAERARYVLADWELPFRATPEGTIAGRFQTLGNWAGIAHDDYYDVCYRRAGDGWTPVWIFYESYYRSMAYRLSVLGGAAATPVGATSVVTLAERREARGRSFCELVAQRTFATYEAAQAAAQAAPAAGATITLAGLDPWQSAFPIPALSSLHQVHAVRTTDQRPGESPWVRIFTVR